MELSHFPDKLKKRRVVFSPQFGKDLDRPEDYRPVTLLSAIGKTMERVLEIYFDNDIAAYRLLNDRQFGFRVYRFIEEAVHSALTSFSSLLMAVLVFDIRGTFDAASCLLFRTRRKRTPILHL